MPKISELGTTAFPSLEHYFPAAKDGETVRLSIQQVRDLLGYMASEIGYGSGSNVEQALMDLFSDKADTTYVDTQDNALSDALLQAISDLSADTSDSLSSINLALDKRVRFDAAQTYTSPERSQLRSNIKWVGGGLRNLLINPLFSINQRAVSGTVTLAAGAWGHDRMKAGNTGCTYTFSTNNGVTTLNITSGSLMQIIEAPAFSGRAGTYVLSWVGTALGRIMADPWGSSGNVNRLCDGSSNISVEFTGGTVSLVQFEKDYVTDFCAPSIQQDLLDARRYYANMRLTYSGNSVLGFTSFNRQWINPPMRTNPTVTGVVASNSGFSTTLANAAAGPETCIIGITATATQPNSEFTVDVKLNAEI